MAFENEPPIESADVDPVHLWDVRASYPVDHGAGRKRPSYDNLRFAVVARSMERVMAVARERYPDIRFHSIEKRNYMGKTAVMIDPEASDVR